MDKPQLFTQNVRKNQECSLSARTSGQSGVNLQKITNGPYPDQMPGY